MEELILNIEELAQRSNAIRKQYHQLEMQQDGHAWTTEQDALAFLTDASLVGRQVMAQAGSWPDGKDEQLLADKIGESVWWLSILASENGIDLNEAVEGFLSAKESQLNQ